MEKGKVYLIGAGPGKPDLITVRGYNILKDADVVIYDYLVDKKALESVKENAELIDCASLGNNSEGGASLRQDRINKLLVKKSKEGRKIVRLKGGDPAIFGRCSDELEALAKEKIEFELVPGVTAASAASSFSGIPLTGRGFASSCVFVTGQEDPFKKESLVDWDTLPKTGTVVFYMGAGNLKEITARLISGGKDKNTPVAVIQNASYLNQKVLTGNLDDIAGKVKKQSFTPPAVIIVGEAAKLEKKFNWRKRNKRILFTGLSTERYFLKGTHEHVPFIKIEPLRDYEEFDAYLKIIEDFDWVVFTSRYGVEHFFRRLKDAGFDARKLHKVKIAAIGQSTGKKLNEYFLETDLVPPDESSGGLVESFRKIDLKGKKIFMPRSNISDKGLEKELKALGANVTASVAYKNVMPEDLPKLDFSGFDEIMFTSPSTVRNFKKKYKRVPGHIRVSCIGNVTLKEAKRCHLVT
ncbi:MAG: uroporphyrinogen-III C-methyltransferase [Candidatus Omnitrophica bacterium]|nr:uroporphyrinogen-III C-methyltransferase [Candidatus Omnitrophota bacterium]MBU1128069.1 uroporphyrinogen-III C-methyltransferase [Candidatus Omnitrophota bacterium]MBU1785105.1 uroporphyrinogen-III C-methyltransferase [Candidatus Omnitrophota bacterium]MBU1851068.1 uroporphyrinogen-III C-methyltransferase [Candidatus Omnitrophota bacterium]